MSPRNRLTCPRGSCPGCGEGRSPQRSVAPLSLVRATPTRTQRQPHERAYSARTLRTAARTRPQRPRAPTLAHTRHTTSRGTAQSHRVWLMSRGVVLRCVAARSACAELESSPSAFDTATGYPRPRSCAGWRRLRVWAQRVSRAVRQSQWRASTWRPRAIELRASRARARASRAAHACVCDCVSFRCAHVRMM